MGDILNINGNVAIPIRCIIQSNGVKFFCEHICADGDEYVMPANQTLLLQEAAMPNGQIGLNVAKVAEAIGKPTTLRLSRQGAWVFDATDATFLAQMRGILSGIMPAAPAMPDKIRRFG